MQIVDNDRKGATDPLPNIKNIYLYFELSWVWFGWVGLGWVMLSWVWFGWVGLGSVELSWVGLRNNPN